MDCKLIDLMKRYQKAETYMDNQDIPITDRKKHIDRFRSLIKELEELTKELTYEELEKLYQEVQCG